MGHKLLLADDSITIQKVVELILAEENFEIRSVNNGEEALAVIRSFKPDVVLADIEMPKMNGYQLCEKIKGNPATSGIPVILLTGAFEPIDEELGKQVHADDFIVKPFESQELVNKIHAALIASEGAGVEIVSAPDEAEGIVEAEAVGFEEAALEEDLWAMEELPETEDEFKGWPSEEGTEAGTEEFVELAEEAETISEADIEEEPEVTKKPAAAEFAVPVADVSIPSGDELKAVFEKAVQAKISSSLSSIDIKEVLLSSMMPIVKDSVEKILWEVAPDLAERMLKEMLKGSLESLTKEVEKVIWETVPDLAETLISKEIERIRSEF